MTITDEELMIRFQAGNGHAFQLLFERYRGPVYNFVYRMLNHRQDAAEDLLQEIFVKVHRAGPRYEPRAKFSTWLFTIARNHCLNFIRSRGYRNAQQSVSMDTPAGEHNVHQQVAVGAGDQPRREVEMRELKDTLEGCIAALSEPNKTVFLLHAVEGLRHREIARILETNEVTVRAQYRRARLALRDQLGPLVDSPKETP